MKLHYKPIKHCNNIIGELRYYDQFEKLITSPIRHIVFFQIENNVYDKTLQSVGIELRIEMTL